eukprot:ANDGO_08529.mRNA.1 hypothetical protein
MRAVFFATVVIGLALLSVSRADNDACTVAVLQGLRPSQLQACVDLIPLSSTVQSQTVAQLRNLVKLYAFADISTDSGAPFYIKVDLNAELDRIAATAYASDYAFHQDLSEVFARLGDAHTLYFPPAAYYTFLYVLPFQVTASVADNNQFLVVAAGETVIAGSRYSAWVGGQIDLQKYIGRPILSVDGLPIKDYIQGLGDRAGVSRDHGVRFNNAVKNLIPALAIGRSISLPNTDSITFAFGGATTDFVAIPRLIVSQAAFANAADLYARTLPAISGPATVDYEQITFKSKNSKFRRIHKASGHDVHTKDKLKAPEDPYAHYEELKRLTDPTVLPSSVIHPIKPQNVATPENPNAGFTAPKSSLGDVYKHYEQIRKLVGQPSSSNAAASMEPLAIGAATIVASSLNNSVVCTYFADQSVMVMKLATFYMAGSEEYVFGAWYASFLQTMQQCIQFSQTSSVENLLLDVVSNGGGIICLSYNALQSLFPEEWSLPADSFRWLYEPYEIRKSSISDDLSVLPGDSDFDPQSRFDPFTGLPVQNTSWYSYDVWTERAGLWSRHSPLSQFPAECVSSLNFSTFVPNPIRYSFKKMLVLSDGLCGSACSLFNTKLRFHGKAFIVTWGGLLDDVMESSSFTGGNVVEWPDFVSDAQTAGYSGLDTLPTLARARFNFNAMHAGNEDLPREFSRVPGDFRILDWNFAYEQSAQTMVPVYSKAVLFFEDPAWKTGVEPLGQYWTPSEFSLQARAIPEVAAPKSSYSSGDIVVSIAVACGVIGAIALIGAIVFLRIRSKRAQSYDKV